MFLKRTNNFKSFSVFILAAISVATPTPMQLPPPPPSSGVSSQFQMTPPPPPHSERSEAVGSERRDETVMGPPPKSGTISNYDKTAKRKWHTLRF